MYARFVAKNGSEKDSALEFNYAANCTPGGSMMSRMMPIPRQVKTDKCILKIVAGESATVDVLVRTEARPVAVVKAEGKDIEFRAKLPDSWSLMVSKNPITRAVGFGALIPVPVLTNVKLKDGAAVLDSGTVKDLARVVREG